MRKNDKFVRNFDHLDELIKTTDRPISASTWPSSAWFGDTNFEVSEFIPRKWILDYGIEELWNVDQIRILMEQE